MTPHILSHDNDTTLTVAWVWPDGRVRLAHYDMVESIELTPAQWELVTQLRADARNAHAVPSLSGLPLPFDGGIMPPGKE